MAGITQNWRRMIYGFVLVVTVLGGVVLAKDDKARGGPAEPASADKGRDDKSRDDRALEPQFRVTNYQLVKVERIDKQVRQFTYRARLRNRGPAIAGATAVLLDRRQDIEVVDGELAFGAVDRGGSSPSADTFSFRRRGNNADFGDLGESLRWDVRPAAGNRPPVADAGDDQARTVGAHASFDGSRSKDPDGDALSYRWELMSRPAASRAELTAPETVRPDLMIDAPGRYVAGLVVSDGRLSSVEDTVVVTTPNQAPLANAGPDATVALRERAAFSGAASSDPDGDPLTYRWTLASRPAGSSAVLEAATGVTSALTPDVAGSYIVRLIVNDGRVDSTADSVVISTRNSAPVARAGADRSAPVRASLTLDGSASSDADGDTLQFQWTVVSRPIGSVAPLLNPTSVTPSIVIDRPGTYRLRLVVNDGTVASTPDDVDISTVNSAPVANAGPDAHVNLAQVVVLDGSGSTDVDGDPLTYSWSFASVPSGSAAAFDSAAAVTPQFTVDRAGTYVAQLIVFDGVVSSVADTVVVTTRNTAPIARAGDDRAAVAGAQVPLDGSASSDPDGTPVTFMWSFVSVPAGSTTTLVNPTSPTPVFRADRSGLYVVQLVVSDGQLSSDPDTVSVSTTNTAPVARAGADQLSVPVDGVVALDGSASSDAEAQALSFRWALLTAPAGSAAVLSGDQSPMASFVADRPGDYVAQLIVNDGLVDSAPDTVLIRTANRAPLAAAGADQAVAVGATVTLDGTASSDPDGQTLTFDWAFVSAPDGTTASIVPTTQGQATFVADRAGDFVVRVTVSDGASGSSTDDLIVHVAAPGQLAVPATLVWPTIQVGTSGPQTLVVTNTGGSPLTVASAEATGDFLVETASSSCLAGPVAAGGTCELRLTFAPAVAGTRTGSLTITSDAPGSPHTVALSGVGQAATVTAGPATLTFAATLVGQTSAALAGVVTNTGLADVEISSVTISGDFALSASASDRCDNNKVLAPSAACSVTATFKPTASGSRTGEIAIEAHGAGDGTLLSRSIALQGDGVPPPVVSLSVTDGSASEFGNDPGTITLSRTGSVSSALTVQYTVSGSATNGVDVTQLPGSVTFAAGQGTVAITVTPVTDNLNEGAEALSITLVDGADYDLGASASGTVSIEDAFQQVTILATDAVGSEMGPDTAAFTVSRVGSTTHPLTVNLVVGGTATAGVDYQAIGASVTIPVGQASAVVLVTPISDAEVEGIETVTLSIGGGSYAMGLETSASININDNMTPLVTVQALDPTASEAGADTGTFRFTRTGDLAGVLTARYTVTGSATNDGATDFTPFLNNDIAFAAGQSTVDVVITPVNDGLVEGTETVTVTLLDQPLYDLGASVSATVSITDPPMPIVTMVVIDPDASEAGLDPGAFRFTRTGDVTAAQTVLYSRGGTAVNSTDYVNIGSSITFPAGQATVDRFIVPINDATVEGPETVTLTLIDGAGYDLGASISGTVTIADQPVPTISVAVVDDTASEAGDQGLFRFTRTGDTTFSLSVTLSRTGSATNGTDYTSIGTTLVFPAGQATVDKIVAPLNDGQVEGPETVVLTIVDGASYDLGAVVTGTVTIQDQPTPIITVQAIDASASETGPDTGTFRFTRVGDTAFALTVNFTRGGSAGSADYNSSAVGTSVTFPIGQATVDKVVTPVPDALVEPAETVVVTLTDGPQYDLGSPAAATVTITD